MADEMTVSSEIVANYLIENGGKVTNQELVKHFKNFLSGPNSQANARAIFKDYVNSVATIKQEDGVKYVFLKKRGHAEKNKDSSSDSTRSEEITVEAKKCRLSEDREVSNRENFFNNGISHSSSSPSVFVTSGEHGTYPTSPVQWSSDLPPGFVPQPPPRRKHSMKGKENRSAKFEASLQKINSEKENVLSSPNKNEFREILSPGTVKEKALFLNKMASEQDVSKIPSHPRRRDDKPSDYDDMCSVSSLDPRRKEWIVKSASGDYHEIVRLLREEPKLAHVTDHHKYTALHYAAKHGNLDVIKLMAGTHRIDANVRTSGGYTPLHIAAMFGREEIMEVLINTYGADSSLRDYSGKRALNYLPKKQAERFLSLFPTMSYPIRLCGKVLAGKNDKEPSLIRMGSLNSKVKKPSVLSASGRAIYRMKSWGSADNIQDRAVNLMPPPKTFPKKKKSRKHTDIIGISENWRGKTPDSDSDSTPGLVA